MIGYLFRFLAAFETKGIDLEGLLLFRRLSSSVERLAIDPKPKPEILNLNLNLGGDPLPILAAFENKGLDLSSFSILHLIRHPY